jgi:hypothetical protein
VASFVVCRPGAKLFYATMSGTTSNSGKPQVINQNQPWCTGPMEILLHGISLLKNDSDTNRRLAMLSIDNSVELMIKTFLGLPDRVTGFKLTRREYEEISLSFPRLLDAIHEHAPDKLRDYDISEIEWFHRLFSTPFSTYPEGGTSSVWNVKTQAVNE